GGVHEAEAGVNLVAVEVQALDFSETELSVPGVAATHDLHGQAGINAGQHADQATADAITSGDFACDVFFGHFAVDVADLATEFTCLLQRGVFQPFRDRQTVLSEVLPEDAVEG